MFYLVRHGEPDYTGRNINIYRGFGMNMYPLTVKGREQIKEKLKESDFY